MSKLHLILPMAGRGSRFFENGFVCPKPLIEINGKPFFYWAARSIEKYVDCADITFVVLQEHIRDFAIDEKIRTYWPEARIIALPEVTEGAAVTALKGCESLPEGEPILFNDCDHLFICSAFNAFCEKGRFADGPAGALLTFESDSPAYSYLQYGADGNVCHTVEKQVVSHDAICGAYFLYPASTMCWQRRAHGSQALRVICTCLSAHRTNTAPQKNRRTAPDLMRWGDRWKENT